jgi:hypothetical protein
VRELFGVVGKHNGGAELAPPNAIVSLSAVQPYFPEVTRRESRR